MLAATTTSRWRWTSLHLLRGQYLPLRVVLPAGLPGTVHRRSTSTLHTSTCSPGPFTKLLAGGQPECRAHHSLLPRSRDHLCQLGRGQGQHREERKRPAEASPDRHRSHPCHESRRTVVQGLNTFATRTRSCTRARLGSNSDEEILGGRMEAF